MSVVFTCFHGDAERNLHEVQITVQPGERRRCFPLHDSSLFLLLSHRRAADMKYCICVIAMKMCFHSAAARRCRSVRPVLGWTLKFTTHTNNQDRCKLYGVNFLNLQLIIKSSLCDVHLCFHSDGRLKLPAKSTRKRLKKGWFSGGSLKDWADLFWFIITTYTLVLWSEMKAEEVF